MIKWSFVIPLLQLSSLSFERLLYSTYENHCVGKSQLKSNTRQDRAKTKSGLTDMKQNNPL